MSTAQPPGVPRTRLRHRLQRPRGALIIVLAILTSCSYVRGAQSTQAQVFGQQLREYQVKAAFLLNFTKFVEWPAVPQDNPGVPFNICILGADPFGSSLEQIVQDEFLAGRKLVVQHVQGDGIHVCQLIYISKGERGLRELLNNPAPGILTVGEGEGFIRDGGIIAFVVENRRVRFHINLRAARAASLKFSSRLLSVAKSVEN